MNNKGLRAVHVAIYNKIKKTREMPAILTENLFIDRKEMMCCSNKNISLICWLRGMRKELRQPSDLKKVSSNKTKPTKYVQVKQK
ncbi:hypothetical protein UP12_03615 [Bacillus pumilus]|nr:hypothetical protein UP12_03615 [Bacillus pumilus]